MKYIDADKLLNEINDRIERCEKDEEDGYPDTTSSEATLKSIRSFIASLQQDKPELDLDYLKNKAELIANGIMIGVQANKYHTCIYDKASNDFNHSHLVRAALKGIEFGLNAEKEE